MPLRGRCRQPPTNRMRTPSATNVTVTGQGRGVRPARVLAADDQQHILDAIELLLRPEGYEVDFARSPVLVREALASGTYDAALIDLNYTRDTTSGKEGLDLISEIAAGDST